MVKHVSTPAAFAPVCRFIRIVRRIARTVTAVLVVLWATPLPIAYAQPSYKQLAGSWTEFASMAAPAPDSTAVQSKSALLPVILQQDSTGRWTWSAEVPVEGERWRFAVLPGPSQVPAAPWNVMVRHPGTGRQTSTAALGVQARIAELGLSNRRVRADYYEFADTARGSQRISIESSQPARGHLLLEGAGPARLVSHQAALNQRAGDRIGIVARIRDRDTGALGIGAAVVTSASLRVTSPDGRVQARQMYDDGAHGDGEPGDGVYGGDFAADSAGEFTGQVVFTGQDNSGGTFVRTAEHLIPVIDDGLRIEGTTAASALVSAHRLGVSIEVSQAKPDAHYRVFAEVWGSAPSVNGVSVPVAWIGGMAAVRNGTIDLGLDTRWLVVAGAQPPLELRNVRIEDPDHFITVAAAERMSLPASALPRSALASAQIVIDEEMRMGPRPMNAALLPSVASYTDGIGHKLLLVHGYCSSNVWGSALPDFDNAAIFEDFDQNRSHDAFAQRIKTFGLPWNSYAIVAHSQGGAAALHLYTYYWSGLDNAGPGRLIQSVGTPYQGTNLAGILASLGSWFGKGCGSQSDLTYSGAAAWLAGIPMANRGKVNYFTTSFTDVFGLIDFCNAVTDLVLTDPDDGVTEQAWGQLPGGVNQGHKTGWCHSVGMRDPAQTLDSTRNTSMNANAARAPSPGSFNKSSPASGSVAQPLSLTLAWGASAGATRYEYCLETSVNSTCDGAWFNVNAATSAGVSSLAPNTTYQWQVRSWNGTTGPIVANAGVWWTFTTQSGPAGLPGAFSKSSPGDGAGLQSGPTLSWGTSAGATSYEYCVETSINSNCEGTWVGVGANTSATPSGLAFNTTYQWQVRARNASGVTNANGGGWWTFTLQTAGPGSFGKSSPPDGASGQSTSVGLSWSASSGATSYEYCVETSVNSGCDGTWINVGSATGVTAGGLSPQTTYQWQVRARNTSGVTSANGGGWWTFTTQGVPGLYFADDMEAGAGNWSAQPPWSNAFEHTFSGVRAWSDSAGGSYGPNLNVSLTSPAIDLRLASAPQLTFWQRRAFAADGYDSGNVWVTLDGGQTFTFLRKFAGTNTLWHQSVVDLAPYAGFASVRVVFQVVSNDSASDDGWYIDDVMVLEATAPQALTKLAPGDGANGQSSTAVLSWSLSEGATQYEYCVDTVNNDACDGQWLGTSNTSAIATGLAAGTRQWWQVRARNTAGVTIADGGRWWSFTTLTVAPSVVTTSATNITANAAALHGTINPNASPATAQFQYGLTTAYGNFSAAVDAGAGVFPVAVTMALDGLTCNTTYHFRLTGQNAGGTSEGGDVSFVTAQCPPPGSFTKTTPSNGASLAATDTFTWAASSGATIYEICIDTIDNGICDTAWVGTGVNRTFSPGSLAPHTTYWWQVVAANTGGATAANDNTWWRFSVPSGGVYYEEGFENGAPGWQFSTPWFVSQERAHGGAWSLSDSFGGPYQPNLNVSATTPAIDLRSATAPQLRFWHWRDFAPDGYDSGNVWVTLDDGQTFTFLKKYNGRDEAGEEAVVDLSAYAGLPSVRLVFQVISDAASSADGWHIDAVVVAESQSLEPFTKLSPQDAGVLAGAPPLLSWAPVRGATSYEYCVDTTHNASCDTAWVSTDLTTAGPPLAPGTSYSWQVRARNASGAIEANANSWWRFITAPTAPRRRGDVDGNGTPDIILQTDAQHQALVLYMGGAGGNVIQGAGWLVQSGLGDWPIRATADFNGDGVIDLIVQNQTTRQVAVLFLAGTQGNVISGGAFLVASSLPGWTVAGAADLNSDGHPDLMLESDVTRQLLVLYFGGPSGTVIQNYDWLAFAGFSGYRVVGTGDFNADGKPDVVWQNEATRNLVIWYMTGIGGTTLHAATELFIGSPQGMGPGWTVIGFVDLNGDGTPDLVAQNDASRQINAWYLGGPTGTVWLGQTGLVPFNLPGWTGIVR